MYQLNLPAAQDVTISLAGAAGQGTFDGVIFVRSSPCAGGVQQGCVDDGFSDDPETLTLYNQSGTIFLFAQAYTSTYATLYDVSVVLSPPTLPPANDSCAAPQALSFTGGTATAAGSFISSANDNGPTDVAPTCSSTARTTGRDLVYSFTTTAAQDVQIDVTPQGASFTPVIYLRSLANCAAGDAPSELGCQVGTSSGVSRRLYNLPAGSYALWVDSTAVVNTGFNLSVQLLPPTLPPTNENCSAPQALAFTAGVATANGSFVAAVNDNGMADVAPTCSAAARTTGRDVVYSLTTVAAQDVEVTVTPQASSFTPVVYLRALASCAAGDAMNELGCAQGTTAGVTRRFVNVPAGSYALWVDSTTAVDTGFSVTVRLLPPTLPPGNDTCAAPEVLALSGNLASVTGQTVAAANDYSATCSTGSGSLGDTTYSLVVPGSSPTPVSFVAAPTDPAFVPSLYVGAACPVAAPLACVAGTTTARARPVGVLLPAQAPGTVYAVVDGQVGTGYYRLDARVGAPPNDTCTTPTPIGLSSVLVDAAALETTQLSTNDFTSMCGFTTRFNGKDLVYSFTPATSGTFTATVQPSPTFDPSVSVLSGGCSPANCLDSADTGASGSPESVTFSGTAGQTYYLVVDGWGTGTSNEGFFRLEVR